MIKESVGDQMGNAVYIVLDFDELLHNVMLLLKGVLELFLHQLMLEDTHRVSCLFWLILY